MRPYAPETLSVAIERLFCRLHLENPPFVSLCSDDLVLSMHDTPSQTVASATPCCHASTHFFSSSAPADQFMLQTSFQACAWNTSMLCFVVSASFPFFSQSVRSRPIWTLAPVLSPNLAAGERDASLHL